jgi:hypothetical protein
MMKLLRLATFLYIVMLLVTACISTITFAQTAPTYIAGSQQTYSYSGAGNSGSPPMVAGIPSVTYNIPAGRNRLLLVSSYIERNHGTTTPNSNWPHDVAGTSYDVVTGRLTATVGVVDATILESRMTVLQSPIGPTNIRFNTSYSISYLSEAQGLPTGNTTISFPNLMLPENAGDEITIVIEVFENANPVPQNLGSTRESSTTLSSVSFTGTAPTSPTGAITDIMYVANGYLS